MATNPDRGYVPFHEKAAPYNRAVDSWLTDRGWTKDGTRWGRANLANAMPGGVRKAQAITLQLLDDAVVNGNIDDLAARLRRSP